MSVEGASARRACGGRVWAHREASPRGVCGEVLEPVLALCGEVLEPILALLGENVWHGSANGAARLQMTAIVSDFGRLCEPMLGMLGRLF